jgi:hypothetical protein
MINSTRQTERKVHVFAFLSRKQFHLYGQPKNTCSIKSLKPSLADPQNEVPVLECMEWTKRSAPRKTGPSLSSAHGNGVQQIVDCFLHRSFMYLRLIGINLFDLSKKPAHMKTKKKRVFMN